MPQIAQVVKSTFRINHIGGNCPYTLSNTTARGVRVQYNAQVKGWMSNAGGEYKSDAFDRALLEKGIIINQSAPRTPMQNGRAEHLMRTLMDKAEAMWHQACIP